MSDLRVIEVDDDEQLPPTVAKLIGLAREALAARDFARVHDLRRSIFERDPTFQTRVYFLTSLILNGDLIEALDFFFETIDSHAVAMDELPYLRSLASTLDAKIKKEVEGQTLQKKKSKKLINWLEFIEERLGVYKTTAVTGRVSEIAAAIQTALDEGNVPGPQEHLAAAQYLKVAALDDDSLRAIDTQTLKRALQHFAIHGQMHVAYTLATYISTRDPTSSLARCVVAQYLLKAGNDHLALVTMLSAKKMHTNSVDVSMPNLAERIHEFFGKMLFKQCPALVNLMHKIICTETYSVGARKIAENALSRPGKANMRFELANELKGRGNFEEALFVRRALLSHTQLILEIDPEDVTAKHELDRCTKEIAEIQQKLA